MDQVKIGKFIAQIRKEHNLTQNKFANILGISNKTVSKWECGNGMPDLSLLIPICSILDISLNELFSGEKLNNENYKRKAEENLRELIENAQNSKLHIIGSEKFKQTDSPCIDNNKIQETNREFWNTIGNDYLRITTLPDWGGHLPSEDKLNLLGNLSGQNILEICCGKGHSLKYAAELGASELWGLDISPSQIAEATDYLNSQDITATLICSPMETDCGLPTSHFDLVFSIYGIGWTTSLDETLKRINSYLKKDGIFIFSWSHPVHKCVTIENGHFLFKNSYFNVSAQ